LLVVLQGELSLGAAGEGPALKTSQHVVCSREGDGLSMQATQDSLLLLLAGEPLDEPVVGYGPFVMNSHDEIMQAMRDFNDGKFGRM
jgi:redox-sensitive bicupin YhaK (pirin superfamily)